MEIAKSGWQLSNRLDAHTDLFFSDAITFVTTIFFD
jgi:hypothetical protein